MLVMNHFMTGRSSSRSAVIAEGNLPSDIDLRIQQTSQAPAPQSLKAASSRPARPPPHNHSNPHPADQPDPRPTITQSRIQQTSQAPRPTVTCGNGSLATENRSP